MYTHMVTPITKTVLFFAIVVSFFLPLITHAANDPKQYTPLEPIPALQNEDGTVTIATYIPSVVKVIIQLAGALAVIMIVVGGVQYVSTDAIGGKSDGKEKIQNAIYGLLLVIGAYIILNTINPGTLQLDLNVDLVEPGATTNIPPTASSTPPSPTSWIGRPWPESWPGGAPTPTHANVLLTIRGTDFPVKYVTNRNNTNCTTIGQACTSLDGLSSSAIQGLQRLSKAADLWGGINTITINGGTEYWMHDIDETPEDRANPNINNSSHRPGGGAIDLDRNSTLDALIKSYPSVSNQTCYAGKPAYQIGTAIYTQENAAHWHVCYR